MTLWLIHNPLILVVSENLISVSSTSSFHFLIQIKIRSWPSCPNYCISYFIGSLFFLKRFECSSRRTILGNLICRPFCWEYFLGSHLKSFLHYSHMSGEGTSSEFTRNNGRKKRWQSAEIKLKLFHSWLLFLYNYYSFYSQIIQKPNGRHQEEQEVSSLMLRVMPSVFDLGSWNSALCGLILIEFIRKLCS